MKTCKKCKAEKNDNEFFVVKSGKTRGYIHPTCLSCEKAVADLWVERNEQYLVEKHKLDYLKNKDLIKEKKDAVWKKKKAAYDKQYALENREKKNATKSRWMKGLQDRSKIRKYNRDYVKARKKTDLGFKLCIIIRDRINKAMANNAKSSSSFSYLGCAVDEVKQHLESLFRPGMTWDNYGYRGWHVDHIIPCAAFDLTDPEQQKKCFHYTNLQPLWAKDNMKKGAKV